MAYQLFSNNASATLAADITAVATTMTLTTGQGARFNALTGGDYELITLYAGATMEIVKATARTGDVLTVVRGQEGTTAAGWPAGTTMEARVTKGTLAAFRHQGTGVETVSVGLDAFSGTPPLWTASTAYVYGQLVRAEVSGADQSFLCITDGTSGSVAPTWNTPGTTVDNTAEWSYLGVTGDSTCAIGAYSIAGGVGATGIGATTIAGERGVSVGWGATTTKRSVAVGAFATATEMYTVCVGDSAFAAAGATSSVALGNTASVTAQRAVAIGENSYNRIPDTVNITGLSLIRKDDGESAGLATLFYTGSESVLFSKIFSLKTLADNVVSISFPAGASFYATELGIIITAAASVTGSPSISFGITGDTTALLASTSVTANAVKDRTKFTPLLLSGINTFTASVKTAATGTTLSGRVYIKGMFLED